MTGQYVSFAAARRDLLDVMQKVGRGVSGKTHLPILMQTHLTVAQGRLRARCHDLEFGVTCHVGVDEQVPGELTVHHRTLLALLSALPDSEEVVIRGRESHSVESDRVEVLSGRSAYTLMGMKPSDYPDFRKPEANGVNSFALPQQALKAALAATVFATGDDENRAILNGILMAVEGGQATFVATDTHRLAVKAVDAPAEVKTGAILPRRAAQNLIALLADEGEACVTVNSGSLHFAISGEEGMEIETSLVHGQFPNWPRVVPKEYRTRIEAATAALRAAARRAAIVAKDDSARLMFRVGETLEITAASEAVGNAREEVEITRDGPKLRIAFNSHYLLQALDAAGTERVALEFTEELKPCVLRPILNDGAQADWFCVLMPMQVV